MPGSTADGTRIARMPSACNRVLVSGRLSSASAFPLLPQTLVTHRISWGYPDFLEQSTSGLHIFPHCHHPLQHVFPIASKTTLGIRKNRNWNNGGFNAHMTLLRSGLSCKVVCEETDWNIVRTWGIKWEYLTGWPRLLLSSYLITENEI